MPTITRSTFTDDSGNNLDGTIWKNSELQKIYDNIDAFLANLGSLWIPAKDWFPDTNSPCASLATRSAGVFQDYQHLAYDGTSGEVAHTTLVMPIWFTGSTLTYRVYWSGIAAGAGGVVWRLGGVAMSDNDTLAVGIGTQVDVTDTFIAIDTLHVSSLSASMTIAGSPAAGDVVRLQLNRNPTDAADTRTADANMIGVRIFF